jgi:hypothetical protein
MRAAPFGIDGITEFVGCSAVQFGATSKSAVAAPRYRCDANLALFGICRPLAKDQLPP